MIRKNVPEKYGAREEHIAYIKKLAAQLGYTPTRADIPNSRLALIKKHYTVWSQIIIDAGLEYFSGERQQALRQKALDERLRKFAQSYPKQCGMEEYIFLKNEYTQKKRRPLGYEPLGAHTDKETIKAYLRALSEELGYSPTIPVTHGANQILKRYKSWFEALEAAGLEHSNTEFQAALRAQMNDAHFRQMLKSMTEGQIEKAV